MSFSSHSKLNKVKTKLYNHPLLILTLKHLRERKRRFCHTIWEILSGVLVFVMLLLMRQVIKHSTLIKDMTSSEKTDKYLNEIVFTPNDSVTRNFMSRVTDTLERSRSIVLPNLEHIRGFSNDIEVLHHLQFINTTNPVAVVRFKKLNNTKYELDYTIDIFDKDKIEPPISKLRSFQIEPVSNHPISLPLMMLQWNIDRTFMEILSGTNIRHNIELPLYYQKSEHAKPFVSKKTPMAIIHQFLIFCTVAAPLPFFLYNSSRLINERRCGLKEMMKIMGVSPNILRLSHLIDTAILSTVYAGLITLMLKTTSTPILPQSNPLIIALTIILHFLNITSLAFITSALSQAYVHAHSLSLIVYVASCALCDICHRNYVSAYQVYLISWFLPHAPMHIFWDEVKHLESIGVGLHFSNIASLHGDQKTYCVSVAVSWVMLLVQQVLIMTLAWYLDLVRPGKHGVPQKWNFCFKATFELFYTSVLNLPALRKRPIAEKKRRKKLNGRQYWVHKKKVTFHVTVEQTERVLRDDRYFQKAPLRGPIAIKISQVTKEYKSGFKRPKVLALDSVNIDIYEGEVTVILGIHGSGKTTLVDIVTGMSAADSGHVYVKGFDTSARMRDVRKNLGICPQEHLTFEYLTVRENITFFQRIRGQKRDIRVTAETLIDRLNLREQANYFSCQLSASQERCLQVACALVGGADILILDEPTLNCDAATRHNLWDLILVIRGDKTIVLTTSSLEEADAVADRVALLSHGKLKCFGTPSFLKDAIGTGFNLSVRLKDNHHIDAICKFMEEALPDAFTIEPFELDDSTLTFILPGKDRAMFPKLFATLEERKTELGIETMRVGVSMEEMFFRFIDDADDEEAILVQTFDDVKEVTGWRLCIQRMRVLMMRNFYQMWSVKYQFLILHMMVPVLGLMVITVTTNSTLSLRSSSPFAPRVPPTVVVDAGPARSGLARVAALNPHLAVVASRDVSRDFKNWTSAEQSTKVVGIEIFDNHSKIYSDAVTQPQASRAVNLFSNIYMSLVMPHGFRLITASSDDTMKFKLFIPKETILCLLWSMWVSFIVTLPLTPFIAMTIREYVDGVRTTHFVVGCPHLLHWLAKMASHTIIYLTIIPPSVLLCAKYLDYEDTLTHDGFLGAIFIALMMFLPAFLLKLYVLSFFLSEQHAVTLIYIQSIALGFSAPIIQILLMDLSEVANIYAFPMHILTLFGRLSPVFTLSELIAKFTGTARMKTYCTHNEHYCDSLLPGNHRTKMLALVCCGPQKDHHKYFSGATITELMTLVFHIFLYSVMLLAVQKRWIQNFLTNVANRNYHEQTPAVYNDFNVYHSKMMCRRMMGCIKTPSLCYGEKPSDKMLLVDNLHKKYVNLCHKSRRVNAVRGISFYVKAGESLVLLGQTGSGKTSALLMVAGSTSVTRGDCSVAGKLLSTQRSEYIANVSFTQRTGGLDDFYSGYDNLRLLCLLHGFRERRAEIFALNCMGYLGLSHYLFEPVHTYNSGCARRLGLCAVLLAAPRAVLLDRPMQSLNPHGRRCVARALGSLGRSGSALLVAEHSLDWRVLDSLFTSVAVMSKGRLAAIGSCRHVRELLANGHTARLKLKLKSIRTYVYEESSESESDSSMRTSSKVRRNDLAVVVLDDPAGLNSKKVQPKSGISLTRRAEEVIEEARAGPSNTTNVHPKSETTFLKEPDDDDDEEDLDSIQSSSSRLEKATIDISRGNISRSNTVLARKVRKSSSRTNKLRSDKSRDVGFEFQPRESKVTSESDDLIKDSPDKVAPRDAVSFDLLATGLEKSILRQLKADFLHEFPTSELAYEHLPMLYFHIQTDLDHVMPHSLMFSKLEMLRNKYQGIVEDYSLGEISVEDVYCLLEKETI